MVRFGPQLQVDKQISPDTLDVIVPSMMLQPLVENSIKHGLSRKVGGGRITIRTARRDGRAVIEVHDDGLGMTEERLADALSERHRPEQRQRAPAHHLRRRLRAEADERDGRRHLRQRRDSRADAARADVRMTDLRAVLVDDEQLARDELGYLLGQIGGVEVIGQAGNGLEALDTIDRLQPDLVFLDVQMPGLTGFEVARRLVDVEARRARSCSSPRSTSTRSRRSRSTRSTTC